MCSVNSISDREIRAFRKKILRFYTAHGRDLPWRETTDPYCITVSEIMLQQTQVERVAPKYLSWIAQWPDWASLANASHLHVQKAWSGLGYNRRALYLRDLAKVIVEKYKGVLPNDPTELEDLPGIGPYTSRAILIFAFNQPLVTLDTNIRRVLLHEFGLSPSITPTALHALAARVLPRRRSRDWHNALMDYSRLRLPARMANLPPLSKQSPFKGSLRQIRGEIIRRLVHGETVTVRSICTSLGRTRPDVEKAIRSLVTDGVITQSRGRLNLAETK